VGLRFLAILWRLELPVVQLPEDETRAPPAA
jgi:hypothetical protein